jgi:hypothetical protein
MCIGVPMQVVESGPDWAWCEADGQRERLDMVLIGPQPVGTWVLAFHGRRAPGDGRAGSRSRPAPAARPWPPCWPATATSTPSLRTWWIAPRNCPNTCAPRTASP